MDEAIQFAWISYNATFPRELLGEQMPALCHRHVWPYFLHLKLTSNLIESAAAYGYVRGIELWQSRVAAQEHGG